MARGYLSIGSNLGDRLQYCHRAIGLLRATPGVELLAISSAYLTEPVGHMDQPDFINLAVGLQCELSAHQLHQRCKSIEFELDRVPGIRWGPRVVDLDLLMLDDQVLNLPNFVLPHPRMHERRFVLEPLAEIAPTSAHPLLKKTAAEMLSTLGDEGGRLKGRICWIDEPIGARTGKHGRVKTA